MSATSITTIMGILEPILNWVAPIAMLSITLYFIRSFFD